MVNNLRQELLFNGTVAQQQLIQGTAVSGAIIVHLLQIHQVSKLYYYVVATKGGCSITSDVSGLVNVGNPISEIPISDGTWQPMIKQENFDPNDDQQAVSDTDLVGNATNAMLETQKQRIIFSTGASSDENITLGLEW